MSFVINIKVIDRSRIGLKVSEIFLCRLWLFLVKWHAEKTRTKTKERYFGWVVLSNIMKIIV